MAGCRHKNVDWTTRLDDEGDEVTVSRVCDDCRAWLSLGPSNDSPPEVQIEIRAADLAIQIAAGYLPKCSDQPFEQACERCGYEDWGGHVECQSGWHSGYLARAIVTHEDPE